MLLEALFSAIAEAVFGHLLQESGLADRARAVLGLDPKRRAFQTALARAYAAFARRYPQWTASLFDETFLKSPEVVPLLAGLLTRRGQPDPAELARRFAAHLGQRDPDRWDRLVEATRAAADFLTWLEAELARQEALQPLYDSRALERTAENTEAIRRALEESWRQALAEARQVNIGGNVTGSILIVGDHNIVQGITSLPTDYGTRIRNFILEYTGTPVHPVPFGGREEALQALDRYLDDPTRRPTSSWPRPPAAANPPSWSAGWSACVAASLTCRSSSSRSACASTPPPRPSSSPPWPPAWPTSSAKRCPPT